MTYTTQQYTVALVAFALIALCALIVPSATYADRVSARFDAGLVRQPVAPTGGDSGSTGGDGGTNGGESGQSGEGGSQSGDEEVSLPDAVPPSEEEEFLGASPSSVFGGGIQDLLNGNGDVGSVLNTVLARFHQ